MIVLAGHGTVDIGIEDDNIVALCIVLAYAQLSLDGLLGLLIAGIPGIDHCCFQNSFFLLFSFTFSFLFFHSAFAGSHKKTKMTEPSRKKKNNCV